MIKFAYPGWEGCLEISPEYATVVVVENKNKLYSYMSALNAEFNGGEKTFMLSEDCKTLKLDAVSEAVLNLIDFSLNSKKTLNSLYKVILTTINSSELSMKFAEQIELLREVVFACEEAVFFPLSYADEIDVTSILKLFDVKIRDDFGDSLLEKLCSYVDVMVELKRIKLLFLLSAKTYLDESQLREFYQHCYYKEVSLVLFESSMVGKPLENEHVLIIDDDLCEIRKNF